MSTIQMTRCHIRYLPTADIKNLSVIVKRTKSHGEIEVNQLNDLLLPQIRCGNTTLIPESRHWIIHLAFWNKQAVKRQFQLVNLVSQWKQNGVLFMMLIIFKYIFGLMITGI
jgi:hypothetical protein